MYKVTLGDTFETISRRVYGTELQADVLRSSNPGVVEPLTPGSTIATPDLQDAPQIQRQNAPSNDINEVAVLIDGKRFRFWENIRITRSIDAMDTVQFSAPFDYTAPGFKETFRPFSYKKTVVTVGGIPLFTGVMVSPDPNISNDKKSISVGCYSTPGVLDDCTPPASSFPLEYNGASLSTIANALCKPFGISVEFKDSAGATFERVAIKPGQTILSFLSDLARFRNLVVSSTSTGKLIFQRSILSGQPVAVLRQGEAPLLSVSPEFKPREYYSHITGIEPTTVRNAGSQFTASNPQLQGVLRPYTFNVENTKKADVKEAVNAKLGRMFGNMAAYSISLPTWRDPRGNLWEPNTIVSLFAPDAMIYSDYKFIIRSVEFERTGDKELAVLNLVLPGAFSGTIPEALPWD